MLCLSIVSHSIIKTFAESKYHFSVLTFILLIISEILSLSSSDKIFSQNSEVHSFVVFFVQSLLILIT